MRRFLQDAHGRVLAFMVLMLLASGCRPPDPISNDQDSATTLPSAAAPFLDSPPAAIPATAEALPAPSTPIDEIAQAPVAEETAGLSPEVAQPSAAEKTAGLAPEAAQAPAAEETAGLNLVPIEFVLPAPAFRGTPVPSNEPNVEKPLDGPRPPFLAPEGTINLASGMPVSASDPVPAVGELDLVTDVDKEASDFGYLQLRPGTEWVQIDLGQRATVYAVLVWHNHADARVYRDVVVQVSDDPDFLVSETVFNNDYDLSSGIGIGSDMGYVETSEGKLIDARGVEGRFVRLYSRGNNVDDNNHYTEIEVFGTPTT